MTSLNQAVTQYLAIRRALGFRLRQPESELRSFVAFLKAKHAKRITTELALSWATRCPATQASTRWVRLNSIRQFAKWYVSVDPRTEVPASAILPRGNHRKPPHIYTDEEIRKLLHAAKRISSPKGLCAHTYATLIGLLAVTGMRVGEAIRLDKSDVDLLHGLIHVRWTKFGKSRIVPIHESTAAALRKYARKRDQVVPPSTPAFFVTERGYRIRYRKVGQAFAKASQNVGLRAVDDGWGHGPRLHDLRHTFAARTMVNWYREGRNVEQELPKLATYLGHVYVNSTYWYLEAVPELLRLATDRILRGQEVKSQ